MTALIRETGFEAAPGDLETRLSRMGGEGNWIRVAEWNDRVVGLIAVHDTPLLHRAEPVARVTLLVVAEGARGKGVGKALLHRAETEASKRGLCIMEVISNHRYADAHDFYRRHGYEQSSLKFKKSLT